MPKGSIIAVVIVISNKRNEYNLTKSIFTVKEITLCICYITTILQLGSRCENQINECAQTPSPCLNGGICNDTDGDFQCNCTLGIVLVYLEKQRTHFCIQNISVLEQFECKITLGCVQLQYQLKQLRKRTFALITTLI